MVVYNKIKLCLMQVVARVM